MEGGGSSAAGRPRASREARSEAGILSLRCTGDGIRSVGNRVVGTGMRGRIRDRQAPAIFPPCQWKGRVGLALNREGLGLYSTPVICQAC